MGPNKEVEKVEKGEHMEEGREGQVH
jgi:hypothetical protein